METKLRSIGIVVGLGIVFAGIAFADFNPENWRYSKDITITNSAAISGRLVEVPLDHDVFSNARGDLSDLRLIANDGSEVPYKLAVERNTFNEENIYPARILNNSFTAEYGSFIIDLEEPGNLNSSLSIISSSENFRRQVEISGSDDMSQWNTLKDNGYIYDYTDRQGDFKAQNTNINYPENAYRYIRVKIFNGGEAPLAVNGARVSKITRSVSREASINPKYQITEDPGKRRTEVVIDLEKKGWPTSNISLDANGENFNREIMVYESNDKNTWRILGQSYIFKLDTPKFKGSSLDVNYPESNSRYLKLEIFNGDNQPISITGVSVRAVLRNILFQYKTPQTYKLYYGNDKARSPEYDLEKFFPYLDTGSYLSAALGAEQANPGFKEEVPPRPPLSEQIPYLLKTVIVLAILVLGFFIFRFMKKVAPRQ